MINLKNLTVIIVTYRTTKKIIEDCIKSVDKRVKILIIENSKKFDHAQYFKKRFPKVKIVCSGKNLGYGKANNLGLTLSKTDYALILNPDIICEKRFFSNLSKIINNKINFSIIGCQYSKDKIFMPAGYFDEKLNNIFKKKFYSNDLDNLTKVEWVTGCSMLINLRKFKNKKIFDKNFFLYFEEFDLCKSVVERGEFVYTAKSLKVHHLGFKSSLGKNLNEKINAINVKEWHWMWSRFYFYKKNYSYLFAVKKLIGKFIKSILKVLFYTITFQTNNKNKYLYRFLGLFNSFLNRPSFYRGKN
jgi:N-acetylglucosaminyl-diphospho-decaprenol L-rhamnosyltransferase